MLTLFGLALAIGLLVNDAIVVVENVERVMHEDGVGPMEATRKSMGQITGALVGIGAVLTAVFIPMAFFSGPTGAIYRQFSVSLVSAMALSVLVALILSPILCSRVLKLSDKRTVMQVLFGWFDKGLQYLTRGYVVLVGHLARRAWIYFVAFILIVGGMGTLFTRLPTGFLPEAAQGVAFAQIKLPTGATQQRLIDSLEEVEAYFFNLPAIQQLGNATGFQLHLQDRGGLGQEVLMQAQGEFLQEAAQSEVLANVRPNGLADNPQFGVNVDRKKAQALGVAIPEVNELLSLAWESRYINDYMRDGRIKRVFMQGDAPDRMLPEGFDKWYVRNEGAR